MQKMPLLVDEYCSYCTVTKGRSKKTVSEYRHDLLTFFRYLEGVRLGCDLEGDDLTELDVSAVNNQQIFSVTAETIMKYMNYTALVRGNSAVTRARKLSSIKGFYNYLVVTKKLMESNPAEHIDSPKLQKKLPKFLTLEESIALLSAVEQDSDSKHRERDYCILTLFLNCGMRLSELTGIDLNDIDREFRSLRVMGKGSKERIIYLNEACGDALKNYIEVRGRDGEIKDKNALFISRNHRRLSNQMVQKIVYKYLDMANLGYKNCSVHKLRHTAATLMYQTGEVDVRVLKDILGHEQLNTTQIYTHVSDKGMEQAMRCNPLAKKKSK